MSDDPIREDLPPSRPVRVPPTLDLQARDLTPRAAPSGAVLPSASAEDAGDTVRDMGENKGQDAVRDTARAAAETAESGSGPEADMPAVDDIRTASPDRPAADGEGQGAAEAAEGQGAAVAAEGQGAAEAAEVRADAEDLPRRAGEGGGAPARFRLPLAVLLAALLAGGVAGGVAAAALMLAGRESAPPMPDLAPLTQRIAALESRPAFDPKALAALTLRLDHADAGLKSMETAVAALKAASAAPAQPQPQPQPQAQPKPPAAADAAALDALKSTLGESRQALAAAQTDITALRQAQGTLDAAMKGLAAAPTAAAQQAQAQAQAQALGARMDDLKKTVDAALASAALRARAAASVAVLAQLKDGLRTGRPFAAELDAARALLGPAAASLEPFAGSAAKGFAPLPQLAQQLAASGTAALAEAAPAGQGSVVDRLLASAGGLVKVRPADSPEAVAADTRLAAAVAALRTGDFDAAATLLSGLPGPAQDRLKDLVAEIAARRAAAGAAAALYQQALAAVSGKMP